MEEWFLVPHVKTCDFPGFVEHFFLKLSMTIFPLYGQTTSQSIKKTTSCKKATELPGLTSSLIGQKNIFLGNKRTEFDYF